MMARPPRAVRGVIFDLDGTLADTLDDITSSVNKALMSMALAPVSRGAVRMMVGDGIRKLMQRASGTDDEAQHAELVTRFRPIYAATLLETTKLYDGIDSMLNAVERAGMAKCVLSNKPHAATVPICEELLSPWQFARFQGGKDGLPLKPDPAGALRLCEVMQLAPGQVLFVGDSEVDIQTARSADMAAIAVLWGYRDRDALEASHPWRIATHPSELKAILTSL